MTKHQTKNAKLYVLTSLLVLTLSPWQHAAANDFIDLAVGNQFVCGLHSTGTVECTAPATTIERVTPPDHIPALVDIEAGATDVCGIDHTGAVHCWGTALAGSYYAPVDLIGYESLSVGHHHWCGVTTTRNIHCEGSDSFGESTTPEPFTAYNQVLARWQSTCGRRSDNSVHCWGDTGPNNNSIAPFEGPLVYMMPQSRTSCGIDTSDQIVCDGTRVPGLEGRFRRMVMSFHSICGARYDGSLACAFDPARDPFRFGDLIPNNERLSDVPTTGNWEKVDGRFTHLTCALSYDGRIACWGRQTENLRIPGTIEALPTPTGVYAEVYGATTIEIFWDAEDLPRYSTPTIRAYEIRRNGELIATINGNSYFDASLEQGVDYTYQIRALGFDDATLSGFSGDLVINTFPDNNGRDTPDSEMDAPLVVANSIEYRFPGWYQVLHSDTHIEVCQGGGSCDVENGSYIVINLTTGTRWENIIVGDGNPLPADDPSGPITPVSAVSVSGQTINWPNDGWYQVQSSTFETVCEGVRHCIVAPGTYTVINHTLGTRWESVQVTADETGSGAPGTPRVVGTSIQWDSTDWYQVQDAEDYRSICEGGSSCDVSPGRYTVINLTTGERWLVEV